MKIPARILERVRGPLLAVAVAGCSSGPVATVATEEPPRPPVPEVAALEPDPDAVAYDPVREAERLERTDRALAATETRRTDRIEAVEAERRDRVQQQLWGGGNVFPIGHGGRWPGGVNPACGRG